MRTLAIIPARGGSKRIPRKNIMNFLGKPMIAYPIENSIRSGIFDEVMVSTEDNEIAEIAKKYGAQIPFMRSEINANDTAGTEDVIFEVLNSYEKLNIHFDIVCCIYPSTPLLTAESLISSKEKLINENYDSLFPVIRYGHPIQRSMKIVNGKIQMVWPENADVRTQDLEVCYHDAGQYYWMFTNQFKKSKQILTSNTGVIELSEMESQDIDNMDDWKLAELKFLKLNNPSINNNTSSEKV